MMELLAELTEAGFIYEAPEDNILLAYESEDIMEEFIDRSDELMEQFGDKYKELLEDRGRLKYTKLNQVYYFELEDDFFIHPGEVVSFIGKSETALEKFAQLMEQQNRKAQALVE